MGIVFAILILCGVVMFHELGHFLLAKACHIIVNEFAFGMGPKILSFKKGDTVYAWRAIPIGGMCVMQGEDEEDMSPGSFQGARVWQRILVVAAGPVFNFILAFGLALIIIFTFGADPCTVKAVSSGSPAEEAGLEAGDLILTYEGTSVANARELYLDVMMDGLPSDGIINLTVERDGQKRELSFETYEAESYKLGISYSQSKSEAKLSAVTEGSAAEAAGLQTGDVIISVDGTDTPTGTELESYFDENPLSAEEINFVYERYGIDYETTVTPKLTKSESGGFSYSTQRVKQGFGTSIGYAFGEIKYWIKATIKSLAGLFNGTFGVQDLSGPVGIVSTVDSVYTESKADGAGSVAASMFNIAILLSANLGVMNLLPLPALDGGRLVFLIIEAIRRKRCDQRIEGMVHLVGMLAIFALAAYIAVNDVLKII